MLLLVMHDLLTYITYIDIANVYIEIFICNTTFARVGDSGLSATRLSS